MKTHFDKNSEDAGYDFGDEHASEEYSKYTERISEKSRLKKVRRFY